MEIMQNVGVSVDRARHVQHVLEIKGKVVVEHYDKYGNLIEKFEATNQVKNAAKDAFLNIMFHGTTPIGTWYVGLIDATGWSAESVSDTLASHAGWTEFTTYTGNRVEWTEGAGASGSITNATPLSFVITTAGSLKGILIASVASGTSGTLWSTIDFDTVKTVSIGDTFKVTYSVTL